MKKFFRFLMVALMGVAMTALFSCEKEVTAPGGGGDNGGGNNGGGGGNNNPYGALVYGSWQVDLLSVNGQNMTPENMLIVLNPDGSGVMNDNGETENNGFTWTINGSTLTIAPRNNQFTFTIDSVTATECAFHGDYIEFGGQDIRGDIRFHMVKSGNNGGGNGNGGDTPDSVPAGWVDLGLISGLLWAECNVGANAPEGAGDFFAWAETATKSDYAWSTYRYGSNWDEITKYCDYPEYGQDGFTDTLRVLEPGDDVATLRVGDGARIPTSGEWIELWAETTHESATVNGVPGVRFTGENGNSIFLPSAGYRRSVLEGDGVYGFYWSSSLDYGYPWRARCFIWGNDRPGESTNDRYYGLSVRAVRAR